MQPQIISDAIERHDPFFTSPKSLALAGFLVGYSGLTREAYTLDMRQFVTWCAEHLRYRSLLRRPVTAYETTRPVPHLTDTDLTREEELVCRIWQQLSEVQAERIAVHLATSDEERGRRRKTKERAALRLSELADRYVETFGKEYISDGQLDYAVLDDREAVLGHARLPRRGRSCSRASGAFDAEHGGSG